MEQTAVMWLTIQLDLAPDNPLVLQAKEMEQQRIMAAHNQGYADGYRDNGNSPIDYYNETFGKL